MTIRPLNDWVCIDRPASPNIVGSIHLPTQTGRKKPEFGKVIAIGKGRKNKRGERLPMQSKVGDVVVFRRFDVEKIKGIAELDNSGKPYIFIRDKDLWAILEPDNTDIFTVRTVDGGISIHVR